MFELEPIGYVISELKERGKRGYARACIEIKEEYTEGIKGLEKCSHMIAVAFLDRSKRILTVDLPFHNGGVFAVRSPDRPNPIGITTSRIEKIDERRIYLEKLDFLDGTPIIDIKPYTMSDCIPGYENSIEDKMIVSRNDGINALLSLASGFHGELCTGIATGVRIVYEALKIKGTMRFDSISAPYGCETDAFQVLCGCTAGNGKLELWNRDYFLISGIEIKLKREPQSLEDALHGDFISVSP
jgi:formylmethanofuran dehydrogenase subunit E